MHVCTSTPACVYLLMAHPTFNNKLHARFKKINKSKKKQCDEYRVTSPMCSQEFETKWMMFMVDFLFQPSALGVSEQASNGCGSPGFGLRFTDKGDIDGDTYCKEDSTAALISAWVKYFTNTVAPLRKEFAAKAEILSKNFLVQQDLGATYPEYKMANPPSRAPKGRVPDDPAPTVGSEIDGGLCITVPIEWLIQKNKDVYEFMKFYLSKAHMIGGLGMKAHDGMTSVPEHQRSGGIQLGIADTEHVFNLAKR